MTLVTGEPSCAKKIMPDGTEVQQKPSVACYVYAFLILLGYLYSIRIRLEMGKNLRAAIEALIGTVTIYLFYSHCSNCQGWVGFFKTIALGLILSAVGIAA